MNCCCAPIPRRRALQFIAVAVGAALAGRQAAVRAAGPYAGPLVDVHTHMRPGIAPDPERLMELYDQVGVKGAWLFGTPWPQAEAAAGAFPTRVVPFFSEGHGRTLAAESVFVDPARLRELLGPAAVRGLGEVICRHAPFQLSAAQGSVSAPPTEDPADDPRLIETYRIAGEHGVLVNVHQEGNHTEELSRALAAAPETTFIWAHAGHSRAFRIPPMMNQHSNLVLDLSARSPWLGANTVLLRPDGRLAPEWSDILHQFPDRIMFGLDLFVRAHYAPDWMAQMTNYYRGLLGQLDPAVAELIAYKNAERLAPFASEA